MNEIDNAMHIAYLLAKQNNDQEQAAIYLRLKEAKAMGYVTVEEGLQRVIGVMGPIDIEKL